MEVGSKVLVGSSKVEGIVVEIGEDSVLVAHKIMAEGREKNIKQWYGFGVVDEVVNKVEEEKKTKYSKKVKSKVEDTKIELGVIPEEVTGDSDGE